MEAEYIKVEYVHNELNKVYSINREISFDEFLNFQESDNPLNLGFTYERIYNSQINNSEHE